MRTVADLPPRRRRPSFRRIGLPPLIAAAFLAFFLLAGGARQFTDYLFFQEVELTAVWRSLLSTQALLVLGFGALFFAILWGNLVLADRIAPAFRPLGPGDELVARYREFVGAQTAKLRIAIALLFSLIAGFGAAGQWKNWLLFRNAQDFGTADPLFNRDIGFYVFQLPFLQFIVGWLFMAVLVALVFTAVAHYFNGGIRLAPAVLDRVTPQVRVHLSALLAALALVKALGYFVQRYTLLFSTRGVVEGATYTDVKAQLPAINLLMFISLVAFVLLLVNTRRRGWTLPGVAIGLWLVLSVVVGAIYPALVQAISVNPAENQKERPYITRNIKATRGALGIEGVTMSPYQYTDELTGEELQANGETIRNVRLWDPSIAKDTYQSLQSIRAYYEFNDVDADRYMIDGKLTQVLTSVRDLNPAGLPDNGRSWVNRHLQYTHGYGAVVAPANAATVDGNPDFTLQDVPPTGEPKISQPRVYYGENLGGYAIVKSKQPELDYSTTSSRYNGKGGVALSSFVRKAALAMRFGEKNLLLSDRITPESRAVYYRDIDLRVRKAAPFLNYDSDPYAVVLDGRIVWVIDAYTTTNHYPYGQRANVNRLPISSGLRTDLNYVRNSVKVTVDAFDGTMTFYRVDEKDPIAAAYDKAFPKLFTDNNRMSDALRSHLRYPEDLFRVQTTMFARYHLENPDEFFNASDAWNVAQDPGTGTLRDPDQRTTTSLALPGRTVDERMEPYYVVTQLPSDEAPTFQILQPFTPRSARDERRNLTAFMVAKSDPGNYGKLEAYVMPTGQQVAGPSLVGSEMQADEEVSSTESLLSRGGSEVRRGNIVMLPVGRSIIAVRPLYVQAAGQKLPQLRKVIVWHANRVRMADTLSEALKALFGDAPETLERAAGGDDGAPAPTEPVAASVTDLLNRAQAAFEAADKALRDGDLAAYQRHVAEAREHLRRAQEASSRSTSTSTTQPSTAA